MNTQEWLRCSSWIPQSFRFNTDQVWKYKPLNNFYKEMVVYNHVHKHNQMHAGYGFAQSVQSANTYHLLSCKSL